MKKIRFAACAVTLVLSATGVAACGSGGEHTSGDTRTGVNKNAPLYDELPESVRRAGVITNGADMTYPPFEFYDKNGGLDGMEPELGKALSKQLGVPIKWVNGSTDNQLLALSSKRFDIAFMAVTWTPERQKTYDFVNYLSSSHGFGTLTKNVDKVHQELDLCGKSVAASSGSSSETYAFELRDKCKSEGAGSVTVLSLDSRSAALLAVRQGKAFAMVDIGPVISYTAKQPDASFLGHPDVDVLGSEYGIVFRKDETALRDVVQKAMQALVDDGTYAKILAKWGMSALALPSITVNGA